MDKGRKTLEQKILGAEIQISLTDNHIWGCSIFVLGAPLQGGPTWIPKWEPRAMIRVYLGHYTLHACSFSLVFNTITGNFFPQYHLVFDKTFYTMEHIRNITVPKNWKNLVEEHSELAMQKTSLLQKSGILTNHK